MVQIMAGGLLWAQTTPTSLSLGFRRQTRNTEIRIRQAGCGWPWPFQHLSILHQEGVLGWSRGPILCFPNSPSPYVNNMRPKSFMRLCLG